MYEFKGRNKLELTNSKGALFLEKDGEYINILFQKNELALSIAGAVNVSDFILGYIGYSDLEEGVIANDGNVIGALGMKRLVIRQNSGETGALYLILKTMSKTYSWKGDKADNQALSRFVKSISTREEVCEYPRTNKPIPVVTAEAVDEIGDISLVEAIYLEAFSKKYMATLKEHDSSSPKVLNAIQSVRDLIEVLNIKTNLFKKEE